LNAAKPPVTGGFAAIVCSRVLHFSGFCMEHSREWSVESGEWSYVDAGAAVFAKCED
jgi:hypothetical protein